VILPADKLRALGYQGTYMAVGKIVSPWRQGNVDFERPANDVTIPALPPPVLTDPTQRQISPHIGDVAHDPAPRPHGWQRADRRCVESRVTRLRGDAVADDGLSSAAHTVPARTGHHRAAVAPNRQRLTSVDGPRR